MKTIHNEEYSYLIDKLKTLRVNQGVTQFDFAKKLGSSQSYISKIENKQVRLDIVQLKKIAKVLDIKFEDLIK